MGRPPQFTNADLLATARRIFARNGLAAPVKDIAAELGISEAAIFKRYPAKTDLVCAAMVPPAPDMDALLRPLEQPEDARVALAQVVANLLAYFCETIPVVLPLLSQPDIAPDHLMRLSSEAAIATIAGMLSQRLSALARRGRLDVADPAAAAGLLITTAHSLALFQIMGFHAGTTPPHLIEAMVDTLWRGVAS